MTFSVEEVRKEIQGFAGYCYSHHGVGSEMIDIATEYAAMLEQREAVTGEPVVVRWRKPGYAWQYQSPEAINKQAVETLLGHGWERQPLYASRHTRQVTDGYVLVPVNPTPKMVDSTWDHDIDKNGGIESQGSRNKRIYAAMLAAAPPAPSDKVE